MNTDAIRKIIALRRVDVERWEHLLDAAQVQETAEIDKADAELTALEAENAKLKRANSNLSGALKDGIVRAVECELADDVLSSPLDGMVFVDREKLREIEWCVPRYNGHEDIGHCPACGGPIGNHETDCWLAALLKDADGD